MPMNEGHRKFQNMTSETHQSSSYSNRKQWQKWYMLHGHVGPWRVPQDMRALALADPVYNSASRSKNMKSAGSGTTDAFIKAF